MFRKERRSYLYEIWIEFMIIAIDNDLIESLDSDLSFATCKRLVIVGMF